MRFGRLYLLLLIFIGVFAASNAAQANLEVDEETGSTYYVYNDSGEGHSGDDAPSGNGDVYRYGSPIDSRDDSLIDELQAAKINLDEHGNPIVVTLARGNTGRREVAFTFDDGPHPVYTSKILSILQHYRIRATFFMVGFMMNKYPHWAKMTAQLGNEIGTHTYDHFRLTSLPDDEVVYQIKQSVDAIAEITGQRPRFLRPPGGRYDQAVLKRIAEHKLAVALWTYNSKDLDVTDPKKLHKSIIDSIEPGSIILLHDGSDATIAILPKLIEDIQAKGYTFVTMSEMLANSTKAGPVSGTGPQDYSDWRIRSYE